MDKNLAQEVIQCLPKDRTVFCYLKDYYAIQILRYIFGNNASIARIKQTRFSNLLNKPLVNQVVTNCGEGHLTDDAMNAVWLEQGEYFILTLGLWDGREAGWSQTSRKGWNLVLQLNFSNLHNILYQNRVKPEYDGLLNSSCHPIYHQRKNDVNRETLAWARLDIDFETGECLVEEIQSDWIRRTKRLLREAQFSKNNQLKSLGYWDVEGSVEDVISYCELLEQNYSKIWAEAMMSAAIFFIHKELGLKKVYFHSAESGAMIKNIKYSKPPVSIYSKLPRAFCFDKVNAAPEFMRTESRYRRLGKKVKNLYWYELNL